MFRKSHSRCTRSPTCRGRSRFYEETLSLKRGSMGNQGEHYWISTTFRPAARADQLRP
jgi:hypothetical protein